MCGFRDISRFINLQFAVLTLLLSMIQPLHAQHGHPIVGSWSGYMNRAEGQPMRALFTFEFSVDQVISGSLIINGQRFPVTSATLDPDTWTVSISAQGKNRSGNSLTYLLNAAFENLDSPTERALAGEWQEGGNSGEFRVVIN